MLRTIPKTATFGEKTLIFSVAALLATMLIIFVVQDILPNQAADPIITLGSRHNIVNIIETSQSYNRHLNEMLFREQHSLSQFFG